MTEVPPANGSEDPPPSSPENHESPDGAAEGDRSAPTRRRFSLIREAATIIGSALILSLLIKTFLVQAFYIPSGSMEDTLKEGDRVMVSRLTPGPWDLQRGDIVVFKDPGEWLPAADTSGHNVFVREATTALTFIGILPQDAGEHLIKRVIGMPGDVVVCCGDDGRVSVNGKLIEETYIKPGSIPSQTPFDVTVPEGMLFVLGDNRQHSQDSRYNQSKPGGGFVPMENVIGKAFVVLWPTPHARVLRNPGDVFATVPEP